jgi:hypothetical protein
MDKFLSCSSQSQPTQSRVALKIGPSTYLAEHYWKISRFLTLTQTFPNGKEAEIFTILGMESQPEISTKNHPMCGKVSPYLADL